MQRYKRYNTEQWQSLIADQANSGLSAAAFCKQYHVGYASFCAWRKRLSRSNPGNPATVAPTFVELTTPESATTEVPPWVVELQVGTDVVLRIAKS